MTVDTPTPLPVPASLLPEWAQFAAQDADGTWWVYEAEPNLQHNGWYENEVGRHRRLGKTAPPAEFRETLIRLTGMTARPSD